MNKYSFRALACLITIMFAITGCKVAQDGTTDFTAVSQSDAETESLEAVVDSFDKASEDFSEELEDSIEIDATDEDIDAIDPDTVVDIDNDGDDEDDEFAAPDLRLCVFPAQKRMCVSNGERSAKFSRFNGCLIPGTRLIAKGHIKLGYNNHRCAIKQDGMLVKRTYKLELTKAFDTTSYKVFSQEKANYEGKVLKGGELLENKEGGWKLSILGRHVEKYTERLDRPVGSVSIETLRPLHIVGSLKRKARKITTGSVAVYHNLAKFKTIYTANDLVWASTCKCPVAGSMDIEVSGSVNGGGSIEFQGCGKAILSRDNGFVTEKELPNCQIEE